MVGGCSACIITLLSHFFAFLLCFYLFLFLLMVSSARHPTGHMMHKVGPIKQGLSHKRASVSIEIPIPVWSHNWIAQLICMHYYNWLPLLLHGCCEHIAWELSNWVFTANSSWNIFCLLFLHRHVSALVLNEQIVWCHMQNCAAHALGDKYFWLCAVPLRSRQERRARSF